MRSSTATRTNFRHADEAGSCESTRMTTLATNRITDAGLGALLARTIRREPFPKGRSSLGTAALMWFKASVSAAHTMHSPMPSKNGF
jgi:hypothetical protein